MAVASWMLRSRNIRSGRYEHSRKDNDEDSVKLDLSKDPAENCTDLLKGISKTQEISEGKKLNYLNSFVKFFLHVNGNLKCTSYTTEEILSCLRVSLFHQSTQVRAGCLRVVRHILQSDEDVQALNNLQYPLLIARSLDVVLRNEIERIQALKLIRKILIISPSKFDISLARSLVSLANAVSEEKDRMLRVCLAALCELSVLNPDLFIKSGGVTAITRNILDCQMPRIVECLCGVLLHLLHFPVMRKNAHIDLYCLAAPYCDFHYRHAWMDKGRDERELRFNCSRLALLSILRSFPGILHFCSPRNSSGLHAIVQVLYLDQLEVRKAILDLLYELLGLPQPEWTDEFAVALNAVDPADPQDCWRLGEGFVVAECRAIMPHLSKFTPNIADIHLAVLLYVFLEAGLLGALVEVIISSDTFISVRATVLLGELLHLMHLLLPPECCDVSPALPGLLARTRSGHHQALAAVTALGQLHALLKRRPASSSLYLDHILKSGGRLETTNTGERTGVGDGFKNPPSFPTGRNPDSIRSSARAKFYHLVRQTSNPEKDIKDVPIINNDIFLRDSGVLQNKEGFHSWNWEVIHAVLKREGDGALSLEDSNHRLFLRRLVHFYLPSSNQYSHSDLTLSGDRHSSDLYTITGCELLKCLLSIQNQPESTKLLLELFSDIANHVDAISTSKSAHDCLFSPQHMATTQCQSYFLFIGHMCQTPRGIKLLQEVGLFKKLMNLATTTNHSCYVKLIVSCFNYASEGSHRLILTKVLTSKLESSRLYATQFLLVLLRAGLPNFEQWAMELLVNQIFDQSQAVSLTALNITQEACERRICLEKLVELRPNFASLGDKGHLLHIRLLSLPRGFRVLGGSRYAINEINRWVEFFNFRYVHLVEAEISDSLTLHQRSEDGRYDRRHSSLSRWSGVRRDIYIPPHLFGQLSQHEQGWSALVDSNVLNSLIIVVNEASKVTSAQNLTENDLLGYKSALWALGHVSTTQNGVQYLIDECFFKSAVEISENSPVYSLRGTAVYVLGLMATTFRGANELFTLGWACVRHSRTECWPVVEEEDWSKAQIANEDGGTTISSSDVPIWAIDSWVDDMVDESGPVGRSSTLPTGNSVQQALQHKRSMSESHRNRDNSCTESTASGVSSADSVLGNLRNTIASAQRDTPSINNTVSSRLSPIPSSSSLSTLKTGLDIIRSSYWTADGPRRVSLSAHSCSNSNSLTVSPPDTNGSRLSHQDLLGYNTLKTLRRVRAHSVRSDSYNRQLNNSISGFDESSIESALYGGPSCSIIAQYGSTTPSEKVPLRDSSSQIGQCYMGITLPRQLIRLFPDEKTYFHLSINELSDIDIKTENSGTQSEQNISDIQQRIDRRSSAYRLLKHDKKMCLLCHRDEKSPVLNMDELTEQQKVRVDVLKHVERLANPVWTKQSKQVLLHLKQRHFHLFQDICLFSEVCNLMSSSGYRLASRRFLQELFLDLNFTDLMFDYNTALQERLFTNRPLVTSKNCDDTITEKGKDKVVFVTASDTNRNVIKGFEVKKVNAEIEKSPGGDSDEQKDETQVKTPEKEVKKCNILDLKLTCSENKFPIKHNQTNFVPQSVKSSLKSPESYKSFNAEVTNKNKNVLLNENNQNFVKTDDT